MALVAPRERVITAIGTRGCTARNSSSTVASFAPACTCNGLRRRMHHDEKSFVPRKMVTRSALERLSAVPCPLRPRKSPEIPR